MAGLEFILLGAAGATATRWQLSRRSRGPAPIAEPPPARAPAPAAPDQLVATWDSRVAVRGGALPGTRLVGLAPIRNGRAADIELVPGQQTTADAITALARVCSALERPLGSVVIERTADNVASKARLLVIDRNPQHEKQVWRTPTLSPETGTAVTGVYADETLARLRWLTPGSGATNVLVAGAPGWGKSRELDLILCESRAATYPHPQTGAPTPWVHTWLADGQQGQSLPDWLDIVAWPATETSETLRMLRAAKRVMDARSRHLARFPWTDAKGRQRRGIGFFDPVLTGLPLLEIVMDECHAPLAEAAEIVALSKEIGRKGRKCGMRLVYATQVPSVQNLGGDIDLRALLAGNVVCFRTKDRISGGMAFAGAAGLDPSELPEEFPDGSPAQGMALLTGPGARPTPMRSLLVEDPYDVAVDLPIAPLHPIDVEAAGQDFATWRERRDLAEGGLGAGAVDFPPPDATLTPVAPTPAPRPDDPTARDVVLKVVTSLVGEHGQATRAQVIAGVGAQLSLRSITDALTQLTESGLIDRRSRGVYGLSAADEAAA